MCDRKATIKISPNIGNPYVSKVKSELKGLSFKDLPFDVGVNSR
jgi:hypothetical protein